jgi:transcription antitermination protein NusB
MLNRRLLRIKIFQALYSFYQSDSDNVNTSFKNLMTSLHKMHELFLRNLWIMIKISEIIDDRHETGKQKFIKTEEDSDQFRRLSDNICIQNLKNNIHYQHLAKTYSISMPDDDDLLRKMARSIEESNQYKEFRISTDTSLDQSVLKSIFKNHIYTDPVLISRFEEMNIHWGHDQYFTGIILMTYFKKESFFTNPEMQLPEVFKPLEFEDSESDEDFVKILFTKTIKHAPEYEAVINMYLENWEPERIALTDIIIMRMAIAEILHFNQIPIRVSLNEYIELTKAFSTPKSKIFVNGVLDKVISHFNREGKFEKIGRGLQDND